jgi:hypothetical protein
MDKELKNNGAADQEKGKKTRNTTKHRKTREKKPNSDFSKHK